MMSKKLIVSMAGSGAWCVAAMLLGDKAWLFLPALASSWAYVIGQGVADVGKGREQLQQRIRSKGK